MSKVLILTIPEFVSVNHYLAYRNLNGKPMSYKTKEAKRLQKEVILEVQRQVKAQGWKTDLNPFQHYIVDADFYFPRIDMDCNNYWKVAFDAITDTGLVWSDDNMACERVSRVFYDNKNPRIIFRISKADFTGVFNNQEQAEEFEDKCKSCQRYKRNCSILNKAKEGRIQDDVEFDPALSSFIVCKKYKEIKGEK